MIFRQSWNRIQFQQVRLCYGMFKTDINCKISVYKNCNFDMSYRKFFQDNLITINFFPDKYRKLYLSRPFEICS